jgi:hypothetical protein
MTEKLTLIRMKNRQMEGQTERITNKEMERKKYGD